MFLNYRKCYFIGNVISLKFKTGLCRSNCHIFFVLTSIFIEEYSLLDWKYVLLVRSSLELVLKINLLLKKMAI